MSDTVKQQARKQARNSADADDVTGQVLLEVFATWPKTDFRYPATALRTRAIHRTIDFYRQQKRRQRNIEESAAVIPSSRSASHDDVEAQFLLGELINQYREPCDRQACRMRYFDGCSWREIAEQVPGPDGKLISQQAWGQRLRPTFDRWAAAIRRSLE